MMQSLRKRPRLLRARNHLDSIISGGRMIPVMYTNHVTFIVYVSKSINAYSKRFSDWDFNPSFYHLPTKYPVA